LAIGIDIGGTFTDLCAVDLATGEVRHGKALSTPADLAEGVFACLDEAGIEASTIHTLVHGSTLAINIAIERKGARAALLVTRGTRDVYAIGRGNRPNAYDPLFRRPKPLIPRHLTFEVDERYTASGERLVELTPAHAAAVATAAREADVDAVAVCFLHSYSSPDHEISMGEALRAALPGAHISLSHEIVREHREYERTSTTALNAYVGPRSRVYLEQLEEGLARRGFLGRFLIMQSNGGVMSPDAAKRVPVAMMESGPVGGVIASAEIGRTIERPHVITFDMGGTTAKTSLIRNAEPTIAHGYYIGGYAEGQPAMLPVVDIVEVGAGGGSIAWIDDVGALRVGPESAGADPGPICYGRGGIAPTVTDANVVLGRIGAAGFLGGRMPLDARSAEDGLIRQLGSLGLDAPELAAGIVRLAVANMVLAVRAVSVERGYDPRDFALLAQGGNGPLHACEVARELAIPTVIVPPLPAHFSAVGMLVADLRHDYVRTYYTPLSSASLDEIGRIFGELEEQGGATLASEGVDADAMVFTQSLDLRYEGQDFALNIPAPAEVVAAGDRSVIHDAFELAHARRYGHHGSGEEAEIVNLRMTAVGKRSKPTFDSGVPVEGRGAAGSRAVHFRDGFVDCAVYSRADLRATEPVVGPAVIEEPASTTLVWPGDVARLGTAGEIVIEVAAP
jgi:N-methylhydantoinase A